MMTNLAIGGWRLLDNDVMEYRPINVVSVGLTLNIVKNFSRRQFKIFLFFIFPQKICFDFSCKLSSAKDNCVLR